MPGDKARPRRGVDTGHHYSFLGGVITVGEPLCRALKHVDCWVRAAGKHNAISLFMVGPVEVFNDWVAGPDWKAFMASVLLVGAPAGTLLGSKDDASRLLLEPVVLLHVSAWRS